MMLPLAPALRLPAANCVEVSGSATDTAEDAIVAAVKRTLPTHQVKKSGLYSRGSDCKIQVFLEEQGFDISVRVERDDSSQVGRANLPVGNVLLELISFWAGLVDAGCAGLCLWPVAPVITTMLFLRAMLTQPKALDFDARVFWFCGGCSGKAPLPGAFYAICCAFPSATTLWAFLLWGKCREARYADAVERAVVQALEQPGLRNVVDPAPEDRFGPMDVLPFEKAGS